METSLISGDMDTTPLFEFSDRAELRQWLEENHSTTPYCWVATTRGKESRHGAVPYPDLVEECLCFGWIDSTVKRLDEGRQAQRISPRKKGSTWSILNTKRFRKLEERGLVAKAGRIAFREAGKKESVAERDQLKTIKVVAAIIRKGDRIFATQRGYGEWKDYWEAPGGKIEPGESPIQALRREIREELDTEINVEKFLTTIEWDYPAFHLTMHCYMCSLLNDSLHLNEHEAARWLRADELRTVNWLPADYQLLPTIENELQSNA